MIHGENINYPPKQIKNICIILDNNSIHIFQGDQIQIIEPLYTISHYIRYNSLYCRSHAYTYEKPP